MTDYNEDKLLRQEVEELTELLRTSPRWKDLRDILAKTGFSCNDVLLAGLFESEDWLEWGAIVTKQGKVYRYERNTKPMTPAEFNYFKCVRNIEKFAREWHPAVKVALQMVSEPGKKD